MAYAPDNKVQTTIATILNVDARPIQQFPQASCV
jgi:hypothetical protein